MIPRKYVHSGFEIESIPNTNTLASNMITPHQNNLSIFITSLNNWLWKGLAGFKPVGSFNNNLQNQTQSKALLSEESRLTGIKKNLKTSFNEVN